YMFLHAEDVIRDFHVTGVQTCALPIFFKVSYRTFFGFILLPINMVLYYNGINNHWIYITIAAILFILNLLTYLVTLRNYQNFLLRKIFYFILYLCTLEIAPYYFIYYWVTKN